VGSGLAFFVVILYGIFMTPKTAKADRPDTQLQSGKVYFLYEDHIGKPVLMSEYEDYDSDYSYFADGNENEYPYFVAIYAPFGQVYNDFDSTGIAIGNPETTGIVWSVPFRFPGQYEDTTTLVRNSGDTLLNYW
jgi:hypothetical protein